MVVFLLLFLTYILLLFVEEEEEDICIFPTEAVLVTFVDLFVNIFGELSCTVVIFLYS